MLVGMPRMSTAPRTPIALVKKSARMPPAKPPMKTTYITPIAVPRPRSRYGHTACSTGVTIANAHAVSTACGMPEDHEPRDAVRRDLQRREERRRQDQRADDHERLGRVLAVGAVEVARRRVEERHRAPAREAEDEAAVQDVVHVQRVVEVEHLQAAEREEPEAERGERGDRRADRRDLLEPGERGLHRRLRGVLVLDHLAEHVVLLVLAARRLLDEERERRRRSRPGCRARRTPSASLRSPPARWSANVAMSPTSSGLRLPSTCWPRFMTADIRARMPIG